MKTEIVPREYLRPFILVTSLFALWGFANDITNPLVAAFATVLEISNAKAALVQLAFYGGYFTMALPAALFIKKYSYKKGILLGLALYAIGAAMFYPAAASEKFGIFLIALYILTFGLAFLETTANPFILAMGDERTATQRLNLAQAFNPIGSLLGMFVASNFILTSLQSDKRDATGNLIFTSLNEVSKASIRTDDLMVIRNPYLALGLFVIIVLVVMAMSKMPDTGDRDPNLDLRSTFKRLMNNGKYRGGVLAQMFNVGAQIMCWTFIIQYAENLGLSKATGQNYNIVAMGIFLSSRFISTWLLKYTSGPKLLMLFGIGGMCTMLGTIFIQGMGGLYCLIATSAFMSLMFPTIYGIALDGLGNDAKIASAGLVMAIVGGALTPPLQGMIIDQGVLFSLPAVNVSFVLPLICFAIISFYGYRVWRNHVVIK